MIALAIQVMSRLLCIREDVDIGWSMLGLDNQGPVPEDLRESVNGVVRKFMELREKELQRTFRELGYPGHNETITAQTILIANVMPLEVVDPSGKTVVQQHSTSLEMVTTVAASTLSTIPNTTHLDEDRALRERELLSLHIRNPSPPIMRAGSSWFRKTPTHVDFRLGPCRVRSMLSPIRSLKLVSSDEACEEQTSITSQEETPPGSTAVALFMSPMDSPTVNSR